MPVALAEQHFSYLVKENEIKDETKVFDRATMLPPLSHKAKAVRSAWQ